MIIMKKPDVRIPRKRTAVISLIIIVILVYMAMNKDAILDRGVSAVVFDKQIAGNLVLDNRNVSADFINAKVSCENIFDDSDTNYCMMSGLVTTYRGGDDASCRCTASDYQSGVNRSGYYYDINVNSSEYWDDLDLPLASWTDTYNATYDAYDLTDYYVNESGDTMTGSLNMSAYNTTYHSSGMNFYNSTGDLVFCIYNNDTHLIVTSSC